MKKNEYVTPEMETVELPGITLLLGVSDVGGDFGGDDDYPPTHH